MSAKENLAKTEVFPELPKFPLAAGEVEILESPKEFGVDILRQIMGAKNRIWISALYIENDASGNKILEALRSAKAANPNLEIKIFVDFHRNQRGRIGSKQTEFAIDKFRGANFEIVGIPVAARESSGVLHTKGVVIDDTLTFSGASFNNVYLQGGEDEKYRVDRYWKFKNKNLADAFVQYLQTALEQSEAAQDFTKGRVEITEETRAAIENLRIKLRETNFQRADPPAEIDESETFAAPVAGFGPDNPVTKTILDLIAAAERNVTIYTPYFNISRDVRDAIATAMKKRGIQVNIILGEKVANDFYRSPKEVRESRGEMDLLSKLKMFGLDALPFHYEQNLRKFAKKFRSEIQNELLNIFLWQDGENTFHPKGVVVDDGELSLITGHNINLRGDTLDAENGIVVVTEDEELKTKIRTEMENILQHAGKLEQPKDLPTRWKYRPGAHVMSRVWPLAKKGS